MKGVKVYDRAFAVCPFLSFAVSLIPSDLKFVMVPPSMLSPDMLLRGIMISSMYISGGLLVIIDSNCFILCIYRQVPHRERSEAAVRFGRSESPPAPCFTVQRGNGSIVQCNKYCKLWPYKKSQVKS